MLYCNNIIFWILLFIPIISQSQQVIYHPEFNTTLLSNITFEQHSSDIWGIEKDGIKYVIIGNYDKVSIFSLENPSQPRLRYEAPGVSSLWRDIKSFKNHLYVTADEGTGGVVIIDMTQAPDKISHSDFKPNLTVGSDLNKTLHRCHNLYIDEKGFMYLAGCNVSKRGVLIFNLNDNLKLPKYVGAADLQYAHDAFTRGDTLYASEVYAGKVGIYDVKDKSKPILLATQSTSRNFTHNVWLSDDGKHMFTTDEKQGGFIDAYDISDLNSIKFLDRFRPLERENDGVIPHNTHFYKGYLITSWYTDGLRIVDAHRPENLVEVAYYDTWEDQNECHRNFFGCWGAFPFTGSDIIYGSDINNGLFIVQVDYKRACYLEGKITDGSGNGIANSKIEILSSQINSKLTLPSGEYKTGQVLSGTFKVLVSHPDYYSKEATVDLRNGEVTILNLSLEKRVPVSVIFNLKDKNGQNLESNVLFNGESNDIYLKTQGESNFSSSILSGLYDLYITRWGFKNVYYPQFHLTPNTTPSINVVLENGYEDNFQTNLGWTVMNLGGVQGAWTRAVPRLTISADGYKANPDSDSDDDGNMAWITGNGIPGANCNDLDNGVSELRSPIFDLTSYNQPTLNFDLWFYGGNGLVPLDDTLKVILSNGITEVAVEEIYKPTLGWKKVRNVDVKRLISSTSNMQLKIIISDQTGPNAHTVEAGFDNFYISQATTSNTDDDRGFQNNVIVYPNPADEFLYIKHKIPGPGETFLITDILGKPVGSGILSETETQIDIKNLTNGVYIFKAANQKAILIIKQ